MTKVSYAKVERRGCFTHSTLMIEKNNSFCHIFSLFILKLAKIELLLYFNDGLRQAQATALRLNLLLMYFNDGLRQAQATALRLNLVPMYFNDGLRQAQATALRS